MEYLNEIHADDFNRFSAVCSLSGGSGSEIELNDHTKKKKKTHAPMKVKW